MSHLELQPGFDFQQAGKEVLAIEREGLAELDQYINQNFTLACEKIFSCPGKVVVMGMEIRPLGAGNGSHICQHRHPLIFCTPRRSRTWRSGYGLAAGCGHRHL